MKLKQHLYILLAFTVFTACQSKNEKKEESEFFHIDVPAAIETQKDIPLSEIAESITYIPLETNPKGLLGYIIKIVKTSSAIYVSDMEKVLKFTPDGKFIRQIGKLGNGPGEYGNAPEFVVAESANSIYITDFRNRSILKFDTTGNFQKRIEIGLHSADFNFWEPDKIVANYTEFNPTGIDSYIQITDFDFNPIATYKNRVTETGDWSIGAGPVYQYNKAFYCLQSYNDTVYRITAKKLEPHGIIAIGKYLFPSDFSRPARGTVGTGGNDMNTAQNKLAFSSILESDKYMIIRLMPGIVRTYENPPLILFNKETKEATAANSYGFVNDIDNGLPFVPKYKMNDNTYIDFAEAFELKTKILGENSKSPSNELLELANSLNENDNPVLMLVKLKE